MLQYKMMQHNIRDDKLKQAKDETKVSFMEVVVVLFLSLKENIN